MDIEEQFQIAQQFRSAQRPSPADEEAAALRAEKKHLRWLALAEQAGARGFAGSNSPDELKRNKFALMLPKAGHLCTSACRVLSMRAGERLRDPFAGPGAPTYRATRKVFVCAKTGAAHVCEPGRCTHGLVTRSGDIVCWISGLVIGRDQLSCSAPAPSEDRPGIVPDARRSAGSYAQERRQAGGGDRDAYAYNRMVAAELAAEKPKPFGPAPAPAGSKRAASGMTPSQARAVKKRNRATAMQRKRIAGGALAGAATTGELAASENEKYGRRAVVASMEKVPRTARDTAFDLCRRLLFGERAEAAMDAKLLEAEERACKTVAAYIKACQEAEAPHRREVCVAIYHSSFYPLLDRAFGMARLRMCDQREVCNYFATAAIAAWRLLNATPLAQEVGGSQFKTVAIGLIYALREGMRVRVRFWRDSRRSLTDREYEALPPEKKAECDERTVWLLPAHDALRCLPSDSEAKRVVKDTASRSIMISLSNIKDYFQSLFNRGLTIEQIEDYCLSSYLAVADSDVGRQVV